MGFPLINHILFITPLFADQLPIQHYLQEQNQSSCRLQIVILSRVAKNRCKTNRTSLFYPPLSLNNPEISGQNKTSSSANLSLPLFYFMCVSSSWCSSFSSLFLCPNWNHLLSCLFEKYCYYWWDTYCPSCPPKREPPKAEPASLIRMTPIQSTPASELTWNVCKALR